MAWGRFEGRVYGRKCTSWRLLSGTSSWGNTVGQAPDSREVVLIAVPFGTNLIGIWSCGLWWLGRRDALAFAEQRGHFAILCMVMI
jgi:hypothetical protein